MKAEQMQEAKTHTHTITNEKRLSKEQNIFLFKLFLL